VGIVEIDTITHTIFLPSSSEAQSLTFRSYVLTRYIRLLLELRSRNDGWYFGGCRSAAYLFPSSFYSSGSNLQSRII